MHTPLANLLASLHQDVSVRITDVHHHLAQFEHSCNEIAADILAVSQFLNDGNEASALLRALHTLLAISNGDIDGKLVFWEDVRTRARLQSPMRWGRAVSVQGRKEDSESETGGRNWWFGSADAPLSSRLFAVVGFLIARKEERKWWVGEWDGGDWADYAFPGKAHYEAWKNELFGRCTRKCNQETGGSRAV